MDIELRILYGIAMVLIYILGIVVGRITKVDKHKEVKFNVKISDCGFDPYNPININYRRDNYAK